MVTLLPQPLSPTTPEGLAFCQIETDTIYGENCAFWCLKTRLQVFDREYSWSPLSDSCKMLLLKSER